MLLNQFKYLLILQLLKTKPIQMHQVYHICKWYAMQCMFPPILKGGSRWGFTESPSIHNLLCLRILQHSDSRLHSGKLNLKISYLGPGHYWFCSCILLGGLLFEQAIWFCRYITLETATPSHQLQEVLCLNEHRRWKAIWFLPHIVW
jgi:hypothetical protein